MSAGVCSVGIINVQVCGDVLDFGWTQVVADI